MTALGWGPGPSLIFGVIFITICSIFTQQAFAAPVYEHETGLEALHEELSNGCYYNFQHYDEGDRILTNEPCLNCTCHNRMLMCYLRVCPFTKAIGENCKVEKREDQCCPVITCPEVPVHLLTSTTTASPSAATDSTELGHLDNYGCTLNELFYSDGARVPSDPSKPCELCYCIRNKTTCIMQECTLHVQGCKPVYQDGVCCPVRYDCDREEEDLLETTVSSGLLLTTTMSPGASTDCKYNSSVYSDGELIKTENACEHCYCMRGEIVCAVQECGQPMEKTGTNCVAIPREGQCCPEYECDNATFTTTLSPSDELTTALGDEVSTESKYPLEGEVAPTVDKLNKADDSGITETESLPSAEHNTEAIIVDESSKTPESEEGTTEGIKLDLPQEKDTTTDKYEHAPATTEPTEKLSDHDVTSPESDAIGVTASSQPSDEQKSTEIPDMIHSEDTTKYNLAGAEGHNQILEQGQVEQESETPKSEIGVDQSTSSHDLSGEEFITHTYDGQPKDIVTESVNVEGTPAPSLSKPEDELSPPKDETDLVSEDSTRLAEDVITTEHSKPESESLEPSTSAPIPESDSDSIQPIDADGEKAPATEQSIDDSTSVSDIQAIVTDEKDTTETEPGQDILTSSPDTAKFTTPSSNLVTEEHTEDKYHEEQTTAKSESEAINVTEKVILTTDESKDLRPETITEQSIEVDSSSSSEKDTEVGQTVENVDANVSDIELSHTTESIDLSSDDQKYLDEQKPIEVSTELGSEPVVDEQGVSTEKAIDSEVPELPVESQPETSEKSVDSETTDKPFYTDLESTEKHLSVGQMETTLEPLSGEELEATPNSFDEAPETTEISDQTEETTKEQPSQVDEQPEATEKPDSELTPEITPNEDDNQLDTSEKSVDDHSQETEKPIDNSIYEQEPSVTEKQSETDVQPEISTQPILADRFPDVSEDESDKHIESNEIPSYSTETPAEGSGQTESTDRPIESDEDKPYTSEKSIDTIENELATTDKYDEGDEQRKVTEKPSLSEEHETEKSIDSTEKETVTSEVPSSSSEQETKQPDERIYVTEVYDKPSDSEGQAPETSEKPDDEQEQTSETSEKPADEQEQTSETSEKPADEQQQIFETSEKPIDEQEQISETSEKPADEQEQTSETSEKPAEEQEQISETSEKPADVEEPVDVQEQSSETSEKPADEQEQISVTSEKPADEQEQTSEASDKLADEQEQISETSEKPVDEQEQISETSEKPVDEQEQISDTTAKPVDEQEQISETSEKPADEQEQISETSEEPADVEEPVAMTTEKQIDVQEQISETSEKPADAEEQFSQTTEKSIDVEEPLAMTSEKAIDVQEQIHEITEKPIDNEIPSLETSETPIENADQVTEFTEKPGESGDEIHESTGKPADSANQLPEVTEKSIDTDGQVFETSEVPTAITDTAPEITEKTILSGEETPEFVEKSTEKTIEEETLSTSEKTAEDVYQATELSVKPIESETEVIDEAKEIEQTPASEIDQTRGEMTDKPPVESVDVEGPITQLPESLGDVTTHNIKPETESPTEANIHVEEQPSISEEQPGGVSQISLTDEDVTKAVPTVEDKLIPQPEEEAPKTEAPVEIGSPEVSTAENVLPQSEHHAIPGEGDCLVDDLTYANNSIVQPTNPCQLSCKCISSIVQCEMIECSPPPSNMVKCMPIFHGDDNCCPTYNCEGTEAKTPPSDSHILEKQPEVEQIPSGVEQTETTPVQEPTKESEFVPDVIVPVVPIEEDISTEKIDKDDQILTQSPIDIEESGTDEISPSKDSPADESTSDLIGTPIDKITESPVTETEIELETERLVPTDNVEHENTASDVSTTTPKLDSITEKSDLPLESEVSSEQPEAVTIKQEEPIEIPVELSTSEYPNEILPTISSHGTIPVEVESSTSIPEPLDTSGIDSNEIPSGEISTEPEILAPELSTEHASIDITTQAIKTPLESFHHEENDVYYTSKPEESYSTISSQENEGKITEHALEISTEGVKIQESETEQFIIELGDISTQPSKEVGLGEESNEVPEAPVESTSAPDIVQDKDVTSAPIAEEEITVTSHDEQESVTAEIKPISHDENEIPTFENIPVQPITEKPLDEDESKSTSLPISSSDSNEEILDLTTSIPSDDTRAETVASVLPVETSSEYPEQEITDRIAPQYPTDLPVKVEETDVTNESEEADKPLKVTESSVVETEKPDASVSSTEEPSVTEQTHVEVTEISTDTIKEATESGIENEIADTDIGAPVPETQTDKHSAILPEGESQETERPHDINTVESTTLAEDIIPHVSDNENELSPEEHISETSVPTSTSIPLDERTTLTSEIVSQTDIASQKPENEQEPSVADITTETNEIITDGPKDIQKPEDGEQLSINEPTENIKISETTVTPDNAQEGIEQSSEHLPNEFIDNRINVSDLPGDIEKQQTEQPVTVAVSVETSSVQSIEEEHTETAVQAEIVGADQESDIKPEEQVTEEIQKATTQYSEPTTIKTSIEESSEEKQETSSEEQPISETTENKLIEISTESQPIASEQTTILASDNLQTDAVNKDTIPDIGQETVIETTEGQISSESDTTTQAEVQKLDTSSEGSPINELPGDKLGEPEPVLSVTEVSEVEESSKETDEALSSDVTTKYPTEDSSAASSSVSPVELEEVKPSAPEYIPSEQTTEDTLPELSTLSSEENIEPEVTEAPIATTKKPETSSIAIDAAEITTISQLPELSTEKLDDNETVHEDISEGEVKPVLSADDNKQTSDVPSISSQEPDYVQVPIEQAPELSQEPSQEPSTSGPVFESSTTQPSYSTQDSLNVTSPPRIPEEESQKPVKPDYQPQQPDDFGQMPQQYPYPPETDDYDEDDSTAFGPGTCRYGGKVYVSAQQIPRDDPCDFCFCFRSDIICLQQSCPPPIPGCHEEPINGFCCPRYECPVSMATVLNVTTTTTTTTTTLPPHFLHHAYKGAASRRGCQIQGKAYQVGEVVKSKSGPCLHCTCGGDGQMKCDPKVCSPQPMIQQMIAAVATSRTGARR